MKRPTAAQPKKQKKAPTAGEQHLHGDIADRALGRAFPKCQECRPFCVSKRLQFRQNRGVNVYLQ